MGYNLSDEQVVREVRLETRTAKSGKSYTMIIVRFTNDYEYESFLNNEQKALIEYAVKDKVLPSSIQLSEVGRAVLK
jgi:hypothetical protein